jgi:galactoside O-acetyltransferase
MFYSQKELNKIKFKHLGKNVLISDKAAIYNCEKISIGDNVRIDDFCIISAGVGGINFENNIHIAPYCSIIGQESIIFESFSGLSSRVSIYSSSDDYSGKYLTNPTIPDKYKNVKSGKVHLKKHVIVGCGSVILPNVTLGEGVAVGALSLINNSFDDFLIIAGSPAKVIKNRSKDLKILEENFNNEIINNNCNIL